MELKKERLPAEEIVNCATHGFGLVLSCAGMVVLLALAILRGDAWHVASCAVYGASLVVLYAASTLYHGARSTKIKRHLQAADHCCIYLLIAGTYTPFTLVTLRGALGWSLFGLVWALALAGILARIFFGNRFRIAAVASYIFLGWMSVVALKPLAALVPLSAVVWIVAGGLAYTSGVIFFASKRIPHNHAVWHVFVLGGSICHYVAVVLYVIPSGS